MGTPATVDATIDAAQALGNRLTASLDATAKSNAKDALCELQELCLGQPLARQNLIREEFINEILENLAGVS